MKSSSSTPASITDIVRREGQEKEQELSSDLKEHIDKTIDLLLKYAKEINF
jgi:hypothetical protein